MAGNIVFFTFLQAGTVQILIFPSERSVFLREYISRLYTVSAYVISKLCVEVLILCVSLLFSVTIPYLMLGLSGNILYYYLLSFLAGLAGGSIGLLISSIAPSCPERTVIWAPICLSTLPNIFLGNIRSVKHFWKPLQYMGVLIPEHHSNPLLVGIE